MTPINKPLYINEYGTYFYDIFNLVPQTIAINTVEKPANSPYEIFQHEDFRTTEIETVERYEHTDSKTGFKLTIPYGYAEIGFNINGKYWVKMNDLQFHDAIFQTREEAIKFATTLLAILTENKKQGIKSSQFIENKS